MALYVHTPGVWGDTRVYTKAISVCQHPWAVYVKCGILTAPTGQDQTTTRRAIHT